MLTLLVWLKRSSGRKSAFLSHAAPTQLTVDRALPLEVKVYRLVVSIHREGAIRFRKEASVNVEAAECRDLRSAVFMRTSANISYTLSTILQSVSTCEPALLAGFCFDVDRYSKYKQKRMT